MKRFWKSVTIESVDAGFTIKLDDRPVKTPLRAALFMPNLEVAQAVCDEWDAVAEDINPADMPMTGFANAAIDHIMHGRAAFVDSIAAYGESDLFCYRAEEPEALVARQAKIWGRWIDWAEQHYSVRLITVSGIMHEQQPSETLARLKTSVADLNDWQLAAAMRLVPISGSLLALLALTEKAAKPADLWSDLVLDELWQEEKWGADDFALKNRRDRETDFMNAARFLALVGG
jgi:chaperone required for assembly of F1-ATPase